MPSTFLFLPCRLEQLLDSYYGMQDEESAARAAHDVDSANFNVNEYASEVLSSKSLPELMAFQNQMVAETRSLDRDMQDLVRVLRGCSGVARAWGSLTLHAPPPPAGVQQLQQVHLRDRHDPPHARLGV